VVHFLTVGTRPMRPQTTFGMTEASRLTGINVRILALWVNRRVVKPSENWGRGRGRGSRWTFSDLVGLRAIARLRQEGVSMQRVRKILEKLRTLTGEDRTLDAIASARLLVMDDGQVVIARSEQEMFELLSGQHRLPLLVDLEGPTREVEAELREKMPDRIPELERDGIIRRVA